MQEEIKFNSGAVVDTRTKEEQERDYTTREITASFTPPQWRHKSEDEIKKFPIFNQDGSGSCVAQTQAKELGIMKFNDDGVYVHFSATDIYQRRVNRPQGGMISDDARRIARDGVTLEVLVPSQDMNDVQMDSTQIENYKREVGKVFAVPNFVKDPVKDIDAIASIIQQTGKGVMVWYYFENREWNSVYPTIENSNLDLYGSGTARHSVTAVDFMLINGVKHLIIEDSWGVGTGQGGRRYIGEHFHRTRNWYASHLMRFRFQEDQPEVVKPQHIFRKNLVFSTEVFTDPDVIALQNILKYEGFFPVNIESTGYYGAITAKAVLNWQIGHSVDSVDELRSLQGRIIGPKSRAALNSLYGN